MRAFRVLASVLVLNVCAGIAGAGEVPDPEVRPATASDVMNVVRKPGSAAVLVNVWATWCQPCVEEFPDLIRLRRDYGGRGLRLVLVSADFDESLADVKKFLAARGVDFVSYLKQGNDMEFINGIYEPWTGALPATFLYDSDGDLRGFWEGKTSYARLEKRLLSVLDGHR